MHFSIDDFQIDNQLVRKQDEIILRRDRDVGIDALQTTSEHVQDIDMAQQLLTVKFQCMKNESIQNL